VGPVRRLDLALTAPGRGARLFFVTRRPDVTFQWEAVDGVGPYRVEVSHDPAFRQVAISVSVAGLTYTHRGLPSGVYHWRLRRSTARGEAVSEERRLAVIEDRAPVLYEPRAGEVVQAAGTALTFAWTRVRDERDYVLEVDRDDRFGSPATKVERDSLYHVVAAQFPEGRHCARVRLAARLDAPWSAPRCFEILHKPRLDAPQVLDPTLDRGRPGGSE
jgi:hypothetical protein